MIFSIIIPTLNSEITINDCVKSVVSQTLVDIEILVIDSVSSDQTLSIIENFNDSRIRIISEKDKGIYDAMNKGILNAKGEWLYFLGSDDTLYNNQVLENVNNKIKNSGLSKVVYGDVTFKHLIPYWANNSLIYDGPFNLQKLQQKNICHQAIFYNKSFLELNSILFNIKYKVCADWDLNLKCWFKTDFLYLDEIIAYFSADGLSSNKITSDLFIQDKEYKIALYSKKYFRALYQLILRILK